MSEAAALLLGQLEAIVEAADARDLARLAGDFEWLRARCLGRLVVPSVSERPEPVDELLDVDAAAALTGRSASWLRKNGRDVPGFVQPGGRGTRARWSRRALEAWAYPANG